MSKVLSKGRLSVIMLLALSFALTAACKKNANTGNTTTGTGTSTTTTTTGGSTAGSPTAALRAYYDAAMRKDVATAKRYLSAGTMRMMEEGAKRMGKTVDQAFEEGAQQTPTTSMPEFSNEKVNGDTATVDIKSQGISLTMPMVKEGGEWKIAMDKMLQDMQNSMGGSTAGGGTQTAPEGDDEDDHGGHEEK